VVSVECEFPICSTVDIRSIRSVKTFGGNKNVDDISSPQKVIDRSVPKSKE
jgi:hypothetical protein